jgi:hypothetical protein
VSGERAEVDVASQAAAAVTKQNIDKASEVKNNLLPKWALDLLMG